MTPHLLFGLALSLASSALAAAPALHGNPAERRVMEAPDLAKLYDRAIKRELSADELFYLAVELRECAAWRGVPLNWGDKRAATLDPARMPAGPSRDAVVAARKRCSWLTMGGPELVAESDRLKAEAVREKSMPALAESIQRTTKMDYRKAADQAIEVLESGDADAIKQVIHYISIEEAFARMKDNLYIDMRIYRAAWYIYFCDHGADCGPGSRDKFYQCIYGTCNDAPMDQWWRAEFKEKDRPTLERYLALIDNIYTRRQWDRFGIRAARYPWIQNGPPLRGSEMGPKPR